MNARIALFVSLITVSAMHGEDIVPAAVNTPGFFSKAFTTITYPLVWTTDKTLAAADSITNNTLGKITGTSYLQGGVLDNHKTTIGRLALLAGTIFATVKAYNWYLAQQAANNTDNSDFDFTFEPTQSESE